MNGFWRRFRTYLIGVGLGLLLVMVFFGNRDWSSWTPERRVLTTIDSSSVSFSERAICQMKCLSIEKKDLQEIQKEAYIQFSESNVKRKPCPIYKLISEGENKKMKMSWEVCEYDEKVKLLSISQEGKKCGC